MTRRLRRVGSVIVAVTVLGVLTWVIGLRWFVHRQIIGALHSAGIGVVQVDVRRVTPWSLELTDFRAGKAAADRVATIDVRYSPSTLWNHRVSDVRLMGVNVDLALGDRRIDVGPLSNIKSSRSSKASAASLDLPFDQIVVQSSSVTFHMSGGTLKLPTQGSLIRQDDGAFRIDVNVAMGDKPLRVAGTIGPGSGDIDLAVTSERLDAAPVAELVSAFLSGTRLTAHGGVSAVARIRRSGGKADVAFTIEPALDSVTLFSHIRSKPPTTVQNISGIIQGEMSVASGTPARGQVTFQNLALAGPSWKSSAEAISGTVAFQDLARLKAQPAQTIHVGKVTVGKTQFTNGLLIFDVAGAQPVDIRKTQWSWLGGTVSAENFRLDPSHPKLDATVQVAAVDLHQLLAFFAANKASGEGKISGQIPVVVDWPAIRFGRGQLQASRGRLLIKDLQAMSAALEQTGQASTSDLKKRVIEALSDFEYDVLRADLVNESGGLMAGVRLSGRGRAGARTPVDTELRIHGIDDVLKLYLGYERQASSSGKNN